MTKRTPPPNNWKMMKLKQVFDFKKGKKVNLVGEPSENSTPYIVIENLRGEPVSKYTNDNGGVRCAGSDILLVWDGANCGTVGSYLEGFVGSTITRLRLKENSINKEYALKFLKANFVYLNSHTTGATIPHLEKTSVYDLDIPIPPLETQQKIVSILEKAEETKKLRLQADELTQKLLQSVFLETFGDPVKNPKNWEKRALKDFGEIRTGNTPFREKLEYYGNFIEWIKSDNINTPYTYLTKSEEMLSEKGAQVGRIAPLNSVLVTCIAGSLSCIGNVAIADRNVAFNQQINAIVPNENISELFLYHLILNTKEYIQSHSTQSMKGMISKSLFGSILYIMPPIETQKKFAELAKRVERISKSQQQSSLEINNLFDVLMQKAFTGELIL